MFKLDKIIRKHITVYDNKIINIDLIFVFKDNNLVWKIKSTFFLLDCKSNNKECLLNKCKKFLHNKSHKIEYENLEELLKDIFEDICKS